MLRWLLLFVAIVPLCACAGGDGYRAYREHVASRGCGGWIERMGGLVSDADDPEQSLAQTRATRVFERLARFDSPSVRRPEVFVLDSGAVGAWAWPDGRIFVTHGLVELLDEDEALLAVFAHEWSHLEDEEHSRGDLASEHRADRAGRRLLRAMGVSGSVMAGMLEKIAPAVDADLEAGIQARIELLEPPITQLAAR